MVVHSIVREVASEKGVPATELPPLYNTIEPEHLDTIVEADGVTVDRIELSYAECTVTVTEGGEVAVD